MKLRNPQPEIQKAIGQRIKDIRTYQNMTMKFLSDKSGVSYQQLRNYETGKHRVPSSRLFVFSKIFDVPMEYFLGEIKEIEERINGTEN